MKLESDTLTAAVRTLGSSTETARLRQRAIATGAFVLFLAAFLFTIGLGQTALLVLLVAAALGAVATVGMLAYRGRSSLRRHFGRARRAGAGAVQSGAEVARLGAVTAWRGGEAAKRAQSKLGAASSRREAVRLNERGVEHRRNGRHQEAVENHRKALSLMRDAGDRKGEAMTENSFALALARAGDDGAALEHFERSLTLLRGLDDDETEGQVLANLGFVHERRGRRNEAEDFLNAALRKLPPESQAYHRVEEQLRRAS